VVCSGSSLVTCYLRMTLEDRQSIRKLHFVAAEEALSRLSQKLTSDHSFPGAVGLLISSTRCIAWLGSLRELPKVFCGDRTTGRTFVAYETVGCHFPGTMIASPSPGQGGIVTPTAASASVFVERN
jgi:hypothetical protein